jgi:hypothetical protein
LASVLLGVVNSRDEDLFLLPCDVIGDRFKSPKIEANEGGGDFGAEISVLLVKLSPWPLVSDDDNLAS